ncbi:MAG TPA: L,D-transpeptidase [Clostridia bacterium]
MLRQKRYLILLLVMVAALMVTAFKIQTVVPAKGVSYNNGKTDGISVQKTEAAGSTASVGKAVTTPNPGASKDASNMRSTENKSLSDILKENHIDNPAVGIKIVIDKSDHTLSLVYNGAKIKSYHVEIGSGGLADKEVEGDLKTPEGIFFVTNKKVMDPPDKYLGSRWLGVSYPNSEDADRGLTQGLIEKQTFDDIMSAFNNGENPPQDSALGGNIGIHGGSTASLGKDWTWGCVGLANSDIEEFFDYIGVGTPIIIEK